MCVREKWIVFIIFKIFLLKKGFFFFNKLYNKLIICYVKLIWVLFVKLVMIFGVVEFCKY